MRTWVGGTYGGGLQGGGEGGRRGGGGGEWYYFMDRGGLSAPKRGSGCTMGMEKGPLLARGKG